MRPTIAVKKGFQHTPDSDYKTLNYRPLGKESEFNSFGAKFFAMCYKCE